jgi:hypothetical protein
MSPVPRLTMAPSAGGRGQTTAARRGHDIAQAIHPMTRKRTRAAIGVLLTLADGTVPAS